MSFAPTSMRGACLNCRFAVKGIQNALRSFGVTLSRLDMTKLPFLKIPCFDSQRLVCGAIPCYEILTGWTNVSTAVPAVKGIPSAYGESKARSTGRQQTGPEYW